MEVTASPASGKTDRGRTTGDACVEWIGAFLKRGLRLIELAGYAPHLRV